MTTRDDIVEAGAKAIEPFADEALGDYGSGSWDGVAITDAALTAMLPLILAGVAEAVESVPCPIHGIHDCSPLLNGCSLPESIARFVKEWTP